jgi:hypothetical protein
LLLRSSGTVITMQPIAPMQPPPSGMLAGISTTTPASGTHPVVDPPLLVPSAPVLEPEVAASPPVELELPVPVVAPSPPPEELELLPEELPDDPPVVLDEPSSTPGPNVEKCVVLALTWLESASVAASEV